MNGERMKGTDRLMGDEEGEGGQGWERGSN